MEDGTLWWYVGLFMASVIVTVPLWLLSEYWLWQDALNRQAKEAAERNRGKPGWLVQVKDNRGEWVTDTPRYVKREVAEMSAQLYEKRGLEARLTDTWGTVDPDQDWRLQPHG